MELLPSDDNEESRKVSSTPTPDVHAGGARKQAARAGTPPADAKPTHTHENTRGALARGSATRLAKWDDCRSLAAEELAEEAENRVRGGRYRLKRRLREAQRRLQHLFRCGLRLWRRLGIRL